VLDILHKYAQMKTAQFEAACRMYSNETLREESTKTGARGFYARAELSRRDYASAHAE
jgi:hypothetical protein